MICTNSFIRLDLVLVTKFVLQTASVVYLTSGVVLYFVSTVLY